MPNMCPASIIKNQYLSNHFENKNINFLIISFDYLYDTPEVLKNVYSTIKNILYNLIQNFEIYNIDIDSVILY